MTRGTKRTLSRLLGPHEIPLLVWSTVAAAGHDLLLRYCRPYRRHCFLKRLRG